MPSTAAVNWLIGRVSELATNTASAAAPSTAISPTSMDVFWMAAAGAMNTAFGNGFDDSDPFAAGQHGGSERRPARPSGLIRHDMRHALRRPIDAARSGKSSCQFARLAEQRAEFAGGIGVDEIVAPALTT